MIRPLRQRHRLMICMLSVLLPVAFAAGLAARKSVPVAAPVPVELTGHAKEFGRVIWTKTDLWPGHRIITSLRRDPGGSGAIALVLRDLVRPDLLLYWAAGAESIPAGLPGNARLLGALSNHLPLPIPTDTRGEAGRFVLYSLADHEVVAVSTFFVLQQD